MLLNTLILIAQVITKDGGVSADYSLNIAIGICGFLIVALAGFAFNSLNNTVKGLSEGFTKFQEDFHKFVQIQAGLNAKFEERTKDHESK